MSDAAIPTWTLLPSLGFQPDDTVSFSEIRPGLSLDFGNFKLSAADLISPRSGEVVSFSGVLATPRTLTEIHFELPRRVESLKQCAAWIVWNLDQQWDDRMFRPARATEWVEEARRYRRLLPWVMSQAEFEARPRCRVRRDWLRLALKTLSEHIASLPDNASIVFAFDGSVFSIQSEKKVIALPAEGLPWLVRFRVEAGRLRRLPKRLMRECIGVSIWESRISLGQYVYEGAFEEYRTRNPSGIQ